MVEWKETFDRLSRFLDPVFGKLMTKFQDKYAMILIVHQYLSVIFF